MSASRALGLIGFATIALHAGSASPLWAQREPTLTVAARAVDTTSRQPAGVAGPYTLTATCPGATGPQCAVWVGQDTTATGRPVDVQWQLVAASEGCPSHVPLEFRDVVFDPELPIAVVPNGASCTLTLAFRLRSAAKLSEDVVRNVSLYITR